MASTSNTRARRQPQAQPIQEEQLLDEQEQEVVIEELERAAARQQRYLKQLLGIAGTLLAALYAYFALHQLLYPWGSSHHARLQGALRPVAVAAGEAGGAATVFVATAAALLYDDDRPTAAWRKLFSTSMTLGLFNFLFWGTAVAKVAQQADWRLEAFWKLLWLPTAPPLVVVLLTLAINSLSMLQPELAALRLSRYRYKKA